MNHLTAVLLAVVALALGMSPAPGPITALDGDTVRQDGVVYRLLGFDALGFREDATPYVAAPSQQNALPPLGDTQFPYRAKTRVLSEIGLLPGDIGIFDIGAERLGALKDGDVVIAQLYDGMTAKTLLRQYIAPALLVSNGEDYQPPLNLKRDDVAIKGVMVSSYRLRL